MTSPAHHSRQVLVIYDGTCGFCQSNIRWLRRLDWLGRFLYRPYQDDALATAFPQLDPVACANALHVITPSGRIFAGGDAVRRLCWHMPLTWPLAVLLALPPLPWLLRTLYPHIARRRHRLGTTCHLP